MIEDNVPLTAPLRLNNIIDDSGKLADWLAAK